MHLDSFTVLAAGCAVLVFLGCTFVYFWLRERSTTALLWWGLPLIFGGAALALYARPAFESDFLSISVGNAARILAVGCLWQGIRVFHGRRPLLVPMMAVVAGWMLICLVPAFVESMLARVVSVSLINAVFCALAAHELWRERAEVLPSRLPLAAAFASFATIMMARAALARVTPFPFGAQPLDPIWLGGFMLTAFVHSAFAAFLFISLIRERKEATQRNFALLDPLTGLMNRRAFSDYALRMQRRRSSQQRVALLVLDLDHFKSINDRYGHETGDKMLVAFADVSTASARPTDLLFRMGGEEFCFVLPETTMSGAIAVAERVRRSFELSEIASRSGAARTTVSVGVAVTDQALDLELLQAAADAAVYEAKARGRNRVVVAEPGSIARPAELEARAQGRLRA